jgi:hypothetical protein
MMDEPASAFRMRSNRGQQIAIGTVPWIEAGKRNSFEQQS